MGEYFKYTGEHPVYNTKYKRFGKFKYLICVIKI